MNYKIIGKYIKRLDFTIPNPKTFFLLAKDITKYKINIDIKSNQIKEKIIEVETSLNLFPDLNIALSFNLILSFKSNQSFFSHWIPLSINVFVSE